MTHEPTSGSEPVPEGEPTQQASTPPAAPTPPPAAQTPPPAAQTPPPAAPGSPAATSSRMDAAQAKEAFSGAHKYDLGLIAAGLVAFIASLLPYYTAHVTMGGLGDISHSWNGWHGFAGPVATLLALVGTALVVAAIMGIELPFPVRMIVLGCFGLALLLTIVALFGNPVSGCGDAKGLGVQCDDGHGIGYWLALLATLAGTGLAFLRFQETAGSTSTA